MILFRAWALLITAGFRNRILRQLRRLRNPRYAFATIFGLGYMAWAIFLQHRGLREVSPTAISAEALPFIELLITGLAAVGVLLAWAFGNERASLAFTEAEVQYFFPAPVTRNQLIHFKIVRSVVRTMVSAAISTFFFARGGAHPFYFAVGTFFGLSTLNLHVTAASFARDALFQEGRKSFIRRFLPVALMLAVVAFAVWAAWTQAPPLAMDGFEKTVAWPRAFLDSRPLYWVVWPIRVPIHVALAQTQAEFVAALPAAAVLLGLHYLWLISANVSFEEGAIASAERRARWVEARRQGGFSAPKGQTKSYRLRVPGRPAVAIAWKNLIAARRVFALRVLPLMLIVAGSLTVASAAILVKQGSGAGVLIGAFCAAGALLLVLLGPATARIDLRHDLPSVDVLRAWPLTGVDIMVAEVGGAALVLAVVQWLLLVAAFAFTFRYPVAGVDSLERVYALLALLPLCPALSVLGLVVQNAAAIFFPAWVAMDATQQRGIEVMGQRLLTLAGTWIALLVAIVPAVVVAGAIGFGLYLAVGIAGALIGAWVCAGILFAEALAAVYALGRAFERVRE